MKNKNIKNKPQKCGRWLFLHSRFFKIFTGEDPRTPLIKGIHQLNPQTLSSTTTAAKGGGGKELESPPLLKQSTRSLSLGYTEIRKSPPPLKQSTRTLSLGYTEIEKKEEGAGARYFLCDL